MKRAGIVLFILASLGVAQSSIPKWVNETVWKSTKISQHDVGISCKDDTPPSVTKYDKFVIVSCRPVKNTGVDDDTKESK